MSPKSLYRRAFWLSFFAVFLFCVTVVAVFVIGAIELFGVTMRVGIGTVIVVTLVSFAFAGLMTVHAESTCEEIRLRMAADTADVAWNLFLRSNPIGWLVWLLLAIPFVSRLMDLPDDDQEK